jgi:subtilase family serine protease
VRASHLLFFCALLCLPFTDALAQQPSPRIVLPVEESQLISLTGNTPPASNSINDRGPVSPSLQLTDLILVLKRDPALQAGFDTFIVSQYDPTSPNFHLWLTPAEVSARFGPSAADVYAVSNWLGAHGLSVNEVAPDGMTIRFSGTTTQIQATFHTSLHNLLVDGQSHIANMADPQIPAALGPVVFGVKALHNFLPRPEHRAGPLVRFNPSAGQWQSAASAGSSMQPALAGLRPELGITIGSGSSAYTVEDVAPYDFATIYNVLPLWNATTPIDGTGQTIAIAGISDINLADVASFRQIFGLPAGIAPKIVVANGVDPGECTATSGACTIDDLTENTLDVEWSGAIAKNASIVLVVSGQTSPMTDTVYSSSNYVIQNATAKILSVSYGECELALGTAGNAAYNNMWQTAAAEGIAVFVAAGDAGAATCDQGQAQSVPYTAQYGLSVSGLASTPYDTAVGGTDLNWGTTAAPYWNSSNNSTTGASAAKYVPEIPWNDTCTNPLLLPVLQEWAQTLQKAGYSASSPIDAESACNFVNQWYLSVYNGTSPKVNLAVLLNTVGGGGGMSNCTNSDGATLVSCSGGYVKPSWQANVSGIPSDGSRGLPDVSFFAGNGLLGSSYLVCVSANGACLTSTSPAAEPVAQEVGGTSVGTPAMAGVMALINQKMAAPQGSPNAELYSIAAKQNYSNCKAESVSTTGSCSFNDVDTGTIAMPCDAGSADCTVSHTGDVIGILSGFNAGTGFDLASGLGSLNISNVVNSWTATVGVTPATVTVTPAQNTVFINQALQVTVTVEGSSGTPTGNVTIAGGGYDGGAETLASGSYTFTVPAGSIAPGAYTLTGSYQGETRPMPKPAVPPPLRSRRQCLSSL